MLENKPISTLGIADDEEEEKTSALPESPIETEDADAFLGVAQDSGNLNPIAVDADRLLQATSSLEGNVRTDEQGNLFTEDDHGARTYVTDIKDAFEGQLGLLGIVSGDTGATALFGNLVGSQISKAVAPVMQVSDDDLLKTTLVAGLGKEKADAILSPDNEEIVVAEPLDKRVMDDARKIAIMARQDGQSAVDVKTAIFADLLSNPSFKDANPIVQGVYAKEVMKVTKQAIASAEKNAQDVSSKAIAQFKAQAVGSLEKTISEFDSQKVTIAPDEAQTAKIRTNLSTITSEISKAQEAIPAAEAKAKIIKATLEWERKNYSTLSDPMTGDIVSGPNVTKHQVNRDSRRVELEGTLKGLELSVSNNKKLIEDRKKLKLEQEKLLTHGKAITMSALGIDLGKKFGEGVLSLITPTGIAQMKGATGKDYFELEPFEQRMSILSTALDTIVKSKEFKDSPKEVRRAQLNLMNQARLAEVNGTLGEDFPQLERSIGFAQDNQFLKQQERRISEVKRRADSAATYEDYRSKFETDFYKKVVDNDDPRTVLEDNKGFLDPKDYGKYEAFLTEPPATFDDVMADPKARRSLKKAALGELEKESATVAATVADSLKFIRGGSRNTKEGLLTSADNAITAVVTSGLKNEHKAALIGLLARNNEISGVARGEFVDGYGFDRLYEMHTALTKATGVYGGWADFMDMYAALDRKLGGVAKDVTNTQKKEIVNNFLNEATAPLVNRMRAAAVSNLATGR